MSYKKNISQALLFIFLFCYNIASGINTSEADSILNNAIENFNLGKYDFAKSEAEKSLKYFQNLETKDKIIQSQILLAEIYYMVDEFDTLTFFFDEIENDLQYLKTEKNYFRLKYLLIKASYYRYIDDLPKCSMYFSEILKLYPKLELNSELKSKMFRQLGNFYLFGTSEYQKAIEMFDSAIIHLNFLDNQPVETFKCHWCIGQALTRIRNYNHAITHFKECELLYKEFPVLFKIHIAYVYSYKMEIFSALNNEKMLNMYFNKINDIFNLNKDSVPSEFERQKFYLNYILAYINISDYYIKVNNYPKAFSILREAEKEAGNSPFLLKYLYDRLSSLYLKSGDLNKATYYAEILLQQQIKTEGKKSEGLAETFFLLSELERKKNNVENQREFLEKANSLKFVSKALRVRVLTNLGMLSTQNKEFQKALEYIEESILLNKSKVDSTVDISSFYKPEDVLENEHFFRCLFLKGDILIGLSQRMPYNKRVIEIEKANYYYKFSIDLFEEYMPFIESEFDVELLLIEKRTKIKSYILFLIESYELTKDFKYITRAFQYIEKSKVATLHQSLIENKSMIIGNIPVDLNEKEKDINLKISKLSKDLKMEGDKPFFNSEIMTMLTDSIGALKFKKRTLIEYLKRHYPEYYSLKYNPTTLNINEVKRNIHKGQALVEYYMVDDFLFILYVSDDYTGFYRLTIDDEFYRAINKLRAHIENPYVNLDNNDEFYEFVKRSNQLYNYLVKPFEEHINEKSLIIVPDDILALLPFDILLNDTSITSLAYDYSEMPFLIKSNPISYAYSASLLFSKAHEDKKFNNVIAFAPVEYPDRSISESLQRIAGTENEVNAIAEIFPTKKFLKKSATEKNFKNISDYNSILHLAVHTLIDEDNSMNSKMVFHPEQKMYGEDGVLYAHEIYNMNFKAPMVVLSSCQSGYGQLKHGEGYKSLAWGFKYAGVPSIIMTLWTVPDKISADIIRLFYKQLREGSSKDLSLQYAKVQYLNNCDPLKSHPFYWSSYNLIGENSPLVVRHSVNYKYVVFFIIYMVVFVFYRKKLKKKRIW